LKIAGLQVKAKKSEKIFVAELPLMKDSFHRTATKPLF